MNTRVKTFVEENINLIDLGCWDELFTNWYLTTTVSPEDDQYHFAALYDTLINCGPLRSYLDTHDIRWNIIKTELQRECNQRIVNGEKKIHFADLTYDLKSFLGFDLRAIEQMIYSCFHGKYGMDDHFILISM